MKDLAKVADLIMEQCALVGASDAVLIVTDSNKLDIAKAIYSSAQNFTNKTKLVSMEPASLDGEEPPSHIAKAMQCADIIFALTTWSITHTCASKSAMQKGAKIISMPAVTAQLVKDYVPVDYGKLKELSNALAGILSDGKSVRIISAIGTDLTLNIAGRKGIAMYGICEPGRFINLPDGEALVSPVSADGILVVDGSMPPDSPTEWGIIGKIKTPIVLQIEAGKITSISGGKEAGVLKNVFAAFPDEAKAVAELGIGTNPLAKVIGNITVDEKALGTIHIAFGNSANIGGTNDVPIHLDAVITSPTVWVDNLCILYDGILCFDHADRSRGNLRG